MKINYNEQYKTTYQPGGFIFHTASHPDDHRGVDKENCSIDVNIWAGYTTCSSLSFPYLHPIRSGLTLFI